MIVHKDTIVGYGITFEAAPPNRQCLFVARFDSNGTFIDRRLICDSLGGAYTMAINWSEIVATADDGYALTASAFNRHDGLFVKLRSDLSVEFIREYRDTISFVEFYDAVIELSDGYLLGGYVQTPNYLLRSFLRKVDKQGLTVWFSYYGEYNVTDLFSDYYQISDSIVVFVGGYIKNENLLSGRGPWVAFINPFDGEVLKEWRPNNYPLEIILHFIHPLPDNKWLLYGKKALQVDPLKVSPFWAIADSAFNILDMRLFGPGADVTNFLWDFAPTPDGNFIAAGEIHAFNPNTEPAQVYGWLYKVSPGLDSLWSRQMIPPITGSKGGYLGGVGVLSSGNMVAGGYAPLGNSVYGWLVKFTPDGCVDTILCNTVPVWEAEELELREPPARVYPNPTAGRFFVELAEGSGPVLVQVLTPDGRVVLEQAIAGSQWLDIIGAPSGLYFCQITDAARVRLVAKLVLER